MTGVFTAGSRRGGARGARARPRCRPAPGPERRRRRRRHVRRVRAAGLWEPTPPGSLPALQPYWGTIRPFVLRSGETCSPAPPPAYSENPGSRFYREAYECYASVNRLTPDQEAIARFWSDDPGETATAPGHSISILTQVVRALDLPLGSAAEAYAKVGVAVAAAFISCWSTKYRFNLLRPVTYVRRLIDPNWTPLLVTPPFPEYLRSLRSVRCGRAGADGPVRCPRLHRQDARTQRACSTLLRVVHRSCPRGRDLEALRWDPLSRRVRARRRAGALRGQARERAPRPLAATRPPVASRSSTAFEATLASLRAR